MSRYSDVQKAVRVEKLRIWFAWMCGGWVGLGVIIASQDIRIVSVVTQVVFGGLGIVATVVAVRMTSALNRRAERERRAVLGDDFPG
ncbi:hypothetical protein [Streptomyces sp. Je 1-369]|uniref:hypothetical protein n=1 Tax=Streptomyces sp. Je 1-369 TaxID=2966192 RepID=UPI00228680AC|nr:hypothetical protein [Streptomyces sp. Je 1-369]WAL93981.1 hypothetical protein NOO62_05380 [Streptomyces sp. Je 1-369]